MRGDPLVQQLYSYDLPVPTLDICAGEGGREGGREGRERVRVRKG